MSEQEKDLQADIDYFLQEQATNALLNQTSFIENLSVQTNLFEQLKSQFFNEMLDQGIYLAPSSFEAGFISLAHTQDLIEQTINASETAFKEIAKVI